MELCDEDGSARPGEVRRFGRGRDGTFGGTCADVRLDRQRLHVGAEHGRKGSERRRVPGALSAGDERYVGCLQIAGSLQIFTIVVERTVRPLV